jgi:hypothetical protein
MRWCELDIAMMRYTFLGQMRHNLTLWIKEIYEIRVLTEFIDGNMPLRLQGLALALALRTGPAT